MSYNGHKNWVHWNVSLWLNNDEGLNALLLKYVRRRNRSQAARELLKELHNQGVYKTPDGAKYSIASIYAAMQAIL